MNKVFISSTEEYQPISHGDSYLYENYLRVTTFLKTRIDKTLVDRIAKPNLVSGNIEWYSVFSGPMLVIAEYDTSHQRFVENEYVNFLTKVNQFIKDLQVSGDQDKKQWAELLTITFSSENNILISNGNEWTIVWGWKFRNKLNFSSPVFVETDSTFLPLDEEKETDEDIDSSIQKEEGKNQEVNETKILDKAIVTDNAISKRMKRVGFFGHVKRFFRWMAYRFWGLMLLIMFTLIVLCICKKCCVDKGNCSKIDRIEEKVIDVEKKVKECCDNDTITLVK